MLKTLRRASDIGSITHGEARRRWRSAVLVAVCCSAAALACGRGADRGASPQPGAPATATAGAARAQPPGAAGRALVTGSATAQTVHGIYVTNGITDCATCHPCGAAGNHPLAWMDQSSSGFHAASANAGLASCQGCHGANLDGVGGTTTIACAQCHGPTWTTTCTLCHGGTDNTTGAPPRATWGNAADAVRIGAHTAHVGATHALSPAFDCGVCHVKPADAFAAGHIDGATATVAFAGLAAQGGLVPTWTRTTASCASTYCHGQFKGGNAANAPVWTTLDGSQRACGTCHGIPPPAPHVQNTGCGTCHTGYTSTTVAAATHVNGAVDVVAMTCTSCHGTAGVNAAPPLGTKGETATTALAVGAHQQHLAGGALAGPLACSECHVVPTSTSHATGTVNVTFGPLSTTGGAAPTFSATTGTCSSTYCHGQFIGGNALNAPVWTTVDGSQVLCGSCHGIPPPAPHIQNTACGNCHTGYTSTTVAAATHVNGTVDVIALTCTSCHGTAGVNAAPPVGTHGETATTALAVGAHQQHLAGGKVGVAVTCDQCHVVPTSTSHSNGTVNVTFGALAAQGGLTPKFDPTTATCASTYCHGAALPGGTNKVPVWTKVDGTQDACGTCHAIPPAAPHVARTDCGSCHPGYTATSVNLATHVDGKVDVVALTCSTCHGAGTRIGIAGADANVAAAPPVDTKGNSAVSARGVGAHVAHVNQASFRSAPIGCSECHFNAVPTSMTHANGTVQFAFGALARNASWGGVTPAPTWDGTSCASTYCHGAFKNGANATMTWAQDITLGCTSCHGAPPGGSHPANATCGNCHSGYTSTSVNPALHLNGALDVTLTCTSCHGVAGAVATASSPLKAAPPVDTAGLASGGIRIGAHQSHMVGRTYSGGIACQDCHPSVATYTTSHPNGVINVAFTNGTAASMNVGTYTAGSGTTAATCASTWCHAVKSSSGYSSGGTLQTPSWTGSISACTACHGTPPNTGQHLNGEHNGYPCGYCHPGYASSSSYNAITVNKALHVNGTRDVGGTGTKINSWSPSTRSCYPQCHGSETW